MKITLAELLIDRYITLGLMVYYTASSSWPAVFVTGDRELAPGNLNPHLVESEQLTCTESEEAELTLALSLPVLEEGQ